MKIREHLSLLAVLCSMAMVVLDAGMLNVALPTLSNALAVGPADIIWSVSAYQMALLVGLLPSAQLAERFGHRRMFVAGLMIYLAASVLCSVSPNLLALLVGRVFQGLGGAVIMALGIAILRVVLGPDRLGKAIGWNALVVALSSAAAPALAAAILAAGSWQWLFLAKLPIGIVALAASIGFPPSNSTRSSIDGVAIVIHAASAVLILFAFERLNSQPAMATVALVGVAGLARWMIAREKMRQVPLWPVDLLANRPLRTAVYASVACFTAQSAGLVALPLLLQLGLGTSVIDTAIVMMFWPVAVAVTAPIAGRLSERADPSILCSIGGMLLGAGLLIACFSPASAGLSPYVAAAVVSGAGFGLFQVPNNRTMFLSAPPDRAAAAGGMQGSARLSGQTFGTLLVGLLLGYYPTTDAVSLAVGLGGLSALVASMVSFSNLPRFVQRHHA
ncbi:MFS transporter [Sphingomonas edaphi]|uniref:MFS transporter n=1 Tax=Sphingomonas edaphi TaxID=2315689 RepID=A0A418PYN3_9SPHN|nr:MFS transporter [Sphingomonas edaphi]RIX27099.1 MFS transporter [Sphingomonas edaphi]